MPGILIRWLTTTAAIVATAYLLDGIQISGFFSAVFAAAMLGFLNAFFRPIALLLTLPINILSLGLFTFIINALMLKRKAFKSLLFNPQFTTEDREAVLKQLAQKMKLSDYTIKFVMYLSDLGIIPALSAIIRFATNLYFEKKKKAKAKRTAK